MELDALGYRNLGRSGIHAGRFGTRRRDHSAIDCIGGWHSTQHWRGVRLSRLNDGISPNEYARNVTVRSVTGYSRRFSLDDAREFVLATNVGGETLSHGDGYPLRLVAPGRRGFEWVRWVTEIETNSTPSWLQPQLPLQ
ncbi:MAG TPA: hypothetical protein DC056_00980 [Dehalococcoidia bacterium]|nr:hypothetical protein [Dehalococcoidia bacterium]